MEPSLERVKVEDLRPGMGVLAIVSLSGEYSYLDSRKVAVLKQRFKGAKVTALRKAGKETVGIDEIFAGDHIAEINDLPAALGFGAISAEVAQFLKEMGFREFLVHPAPAAGPAPAAAPAPPGNGAPAAAAPASEAQARPRTAPGNGPGAAATGGPSAAAAPRPTTDQAPTFRSMKTLSHKKRVAETRYFLERVQAAEQERGDACEMLQDLFQQGRAGKYSTKPAVAMVESILRKDVGSAMAAVAGLRSSDQTYAHCIDMAALFNDVANAIIRAGGREPDERVSRSTLVAGFMHDIGKSKVPQEVLDSTERFAPDSREMELMRSHVEHSAQILSDAGADDAMINVAHYHHVKVDTSRPSSYPHVDYAEVAPLTRLAAIADVYQALTGKRSYKKNWVPGAAVQYLRKLEGTEFDRQMLAKFLAVVGTYPVGSLVRLSTGDLAFVVKVEGQPADRPVVAVVENARGELLRANPLADLSEEPELSIVECVDHYAHYGESLERPFEIFRSLQVI